MIGYPSLPFIQRAVCRRLAQEVNNVRHTGKFLAQLRRALQPTRCHFGGGSIVFFRESICGLVFFGR